jgi:hypothetical protein
MNFELFIKIAIAAVAIFIWIIGAAAKKAKKEQENRKLNTPPGDIFVGEEYLLENYEEQHLENGFFGTNTDAKTQNKKPESKKSEIKKPEGKPLLDVSYYADYIQPETAISEDSDENGINGIELDFTSESILSAVIMKEILERPGGKRFN